MKDHNQSRIQFWALILWASVIIMIGIGGATRLTGSGLSITEWNVVAGIIPPLNTNDWNLLFEKYRQSPEFHHINDHFLLHDFQRIFWLEYIHRLWGRMLAIPLLMLTYSCWKSPSWAKHYKRIIALLWILSIAQGFMGWIMVKSGLHSNPHVSPYKLALHLSFAGGLVFILMNIIRPKPTPYIFKGFYLECALASVCLTIVFGALVAGFKAGLIYNSFPLMGESVIAEEAFAQKPFINNLFANSVMIQWLHRLLASIALVTTLAFVITHWQKNALLRVTVLMLLFVTLQYLLGVITLLTRVEFIWALTHQLNAFLLLSILSWLFWNQKTRSVILNKATPI